MFPGFVDLICAILFAVGVLWCKEIVGRFRNDWKKLREPGEGGRKAAIIIIWLVTLYVAYWILQFSWGIISRIAGAIRSLLS